MIKFATALVLVWMVGSTLFAQEKTQVNGRTFVLQNYTWKEKGIPQDHKVLFDNACVYRDEQWAKWFRDGDERMKEILDLGKAVLFWNPAPEDGAQIIAVYRPKVHRQMALEAGEIVEELRLVSKYHRSIPRTGDIKKSGRKGWLIGIGTAGVVGAVVIASNGDDKECTVCKR